MGVSGFRTRSARRWFERHYARLAEQWPVERTELDVPTTFGTTRVRVCGREDGSPLVLLPGANLTSLSFAPHASALAARHRLFVIDTLGELGMSRQREPMSDVASTVRWLAETLEELGLEHADFAGSSRGGWLAAAFAVAHPARVRTLTLLDAPVFAPLGPGFYAWLLGVMPFALLPTALRTRIGPLRETEAALSFVLRAAPLFRLGACAPVPLGDAELRAIAAPTTVVVAERGAVCGPETVRRRAELIPDCRFELAAGQDHLFTVLAPGQTAGYILARTADTP